MVTPLSKCTCCISLVLFRRESGQSHGCKKNRINPSRGWTTPYAMSSKDVKYIKVVDTLNFAVALQLRFDCRRVNPYQRILEYQFRLELDCHANHVPRLEIVDRAPPSFLPICAECSATTPTIDNINKDTGPQA